MKKDNKQETREPIVKFVKKANKFCRTFWKDGKQCQEWFDKECEIDGAELCLHKAVHDLHCLSCGKKVGSRAK